MLSFTPEQQTIVLAIKKYNVLVDAIAGSAKSSTCLLMAKEYQNKNILLLTYSQKLKEETRKRIILNGLENIESHSFHSFASKYYKPCPTDIPLLEILEKGTRPRIPFSFSIICVDEVQDMTESLYKFVYKLYYDNQKTARLCILGDRNQCIYKFKEADERYIILAEEVFNYNTFIWRKCTLSTSFRINKETAEAVNNTMIHHTRLNAIKTGAKPEYHACNLFCRDKDESVPYIKIKQLLKTNRPEEIFVLAHSVKQSHSKNDNKKPVAILANILSHDNIPVYVPSSDDEKINIKVLTGKVPFLSFHQSKGLETKHVIIIGFDNFYTDNILKLTTKTCPNELYVAVTRHTETLTVFQNEAGSPPSFMNQSLIPKYWDVYNFTKSTGEKPKDYSKTSYYVTELLDYTRQEVMLECIKLLKINKILPPREHIDIETIVKQKWGYEDVSGLLGVVIPAYFEQLLKNETTIHNYIKQMATGDVLDTELTIKDIKSLDLNKITKLSPKTIQDLIKIGIKWYCISTGFIIKNNQIVNLDLINSDQMTKCLEYLGLLKIPISARFEEKVVRELDEKKIIGRIDCITGTTIYEFKCTKEFKSEHILQTALYLWLSGNTKKAQLFNILSGELLEISGTDTDLRNIVIQLVNAKFKKNFIYSDDHFLRKIFSYKKYIDSKEGVDEDSDSILLEEEIVEEEPQQEYVSLLGDDFGRLDSIY